MSKELKVRMRWLAPVVAVVVAGCGATSNPDAGLPMSVDAAVDAGASDAGLLDAGIDAGSVDAGFDAGVDVEPDGGPREPVTSTQVLYSDNFESYASSIALKATYGDQREVAGSLSLDTTVSGSGQKSMRIDYGGDAGCADADIFLSKVFAITSPQTITAQHKFRFEPGFTFARPTSECAGRATSTTELVIGRVTNAPGTVVLSAASGPDGVRWQITVKDIRAQATPATPNAVFRQTYWVRKRAPAAVADGAWHRLSMVIQRETQAARGDGVVRLWIDGEAVIDANGSGTYSGTAPFGSVTYPSVMPAGSARTQSRWFDDVALFEP